MADRLKKLKINPPRRRESERMKKRSASVATTPTSATSVSSAGDTIEVAQKSSDDRVESMQDAPAESSKDGTATGDLPVRPAEPMQATGGDELDLEDAVSLGLPRSFRKLHVLTQPQNDVVSEYSFSNEKDSGLGDDEDENPRGIFKDTLHDVIEISSDDGSPADNFALDSKPWCNMTPAQRKERENMYCEQIGRPIDGDWEMAESYQENIDQEMEECVPLQVIWRTAFADCCTGTSRITSCKTG